MKTEFLSETLLMKSLLHPRHCFAKTRTRRGVKMLNFRFIIILCMFFSCNASKILCFKTPYQKKFPDLNSLVIFDTINKRYWHTSQSGFLITKYQGKYLEDSSMFKLINNYSVSKCFKIIPLNTLSDSIVIKFNNFSNEDEIGGVFLIKNSNDSVVYRKFGTSFNNITLSKTYLKNGNKLLFKNSNFWFYYTLQHEFNTYLFIFNNYYCSKKEHIIDIDTFYFKKYYVKNELQISEGNRKLVRCNCKKIAEQYKTY